MTHMTHMTHFPIEPVLRAHAFPLVGEMRHGASCVMVQNGCAMTTTASGKVAHPRGVVTAGVSIELPPDTLDGLVELARAASYVGMQELYII
jgi:hypothetical protein